MGLEAGLRVVSKLLVGAAIVLGVINDGRLERVLVMQIVGAVAVLPVYWLALRRLHLTRVRTSLPTAVAVLSGGAPFLLWAAVVTAQPSLDALLLSKLAPSSVIGWYAAASKLVGLLIFPATLVAAALYPTFSRLYAQRSVKYGKLVQIALRATVVLGMLSTVGTYLFGDVAVALIYGPEGFAPAATNLKLLAAYLPLVFVDITLGTAIMAASIQTRWIVAKIVSLAVATGLDVALIPLAQARYGNGGLGCAAATFAAELVMFVAAFVLVPVEKKRLAIGLSNDVGRVVAAALIMAGVAWIVRSAQPLLGMTVAVATYFASIYLLGVIRREDVRLVGDVVRLRAPA
jgi:O-antigen/teichoic acid export membrane protein